MRRYTIPKPMLLDAKEKIAGFPVLKVRDVLKSLRNFCWGPAALSRRLGTSAGHARKLIKALEDMGYAKRADPKYDPDLWEVAPGAGRFLCAQGGRAITRKAAVRLVEEFLDRVREVNADPYFLYSVRRVIAFGSFLSNKEKLGDIDLAVTLERREPDADRYEKVAKERVELVSSKGRTFSTFVDMLYWPEHEVILHLKSRSRYLKLHSDQDGVLKDAQTRVIYEMAAPASTSR